MRDLDQNAGPIPRIRLGTARATMRQIRQHRDGVPDDLVRLFALYIDDKPDAARIVVILRVVQALFFRQAGVLLVGLPCFPGTAHNILLSIYLSKKNSERIIARCPRAAPEMNSAPDKLIDN